MYPSNTFLLPKELIRGVHHFEGGPMSLKKLSSNEPSRADSKQAQVLAMLYRKQGATIATVMKATGWQRHSVRGFLTAVVRKRLGLMLVSKKTGEERVYRIVANGASSKRKGRSGRKAA